MLNAANRRFKEPIAQLVRAAVRQDGGSNPPRPISWGFGLIQVL